MDTDTAQPKTEEEKVTPETPVSPQPFKAKVEVVEDTPTKEEEKPQETSEKEDVEVPEVKVDDPLKVEEKTKDTLEVPEVDPDAPLKVEEKPVEEEGTKPNTKLFIAGIIILIVTVVISVSILIFSLRSKATEEVAEVTETPEVTQVVEPTIDREAITVEVLNGSGIAGLAKKGVTLIEALGYTAGKTGNAASVTENELYLSADLMEMKETILKDFETDFDISTVSGEIKDATNSARIILGKELP